jgi:hypothetical protein
MGKDRTPKERKDHCRHVENRFKGERKKAPGPPKRIDTADPMLHNELNGFIANLERLALLESELNLSTR